MNLNRLITECKRETRDKKKPKKRPVFSFLCDAELQAEFRSFCKKNNVNQSKILREFLKSVVK